MVSAKGQVDGARRRARRTLVASSPSVTVEELAAVRQEGQGTVWSWLARGRQEGRIVAVEHDQVALIPTFQLDGDLQLRDDVATVTVRLSSAGMGSWAVWAWWVGHRATLEAAPIDTLNQGRHQQLHDAIDRLTDRNG